jgi:flavin-dependent dehydrogenase
LPGGVAALRALGVSLPSETAFAFRGIRFADENYSAQGSFATSTGMALRRILLHRLLVDHAVASGVEFCWGARVTRIDGEMLGTPRGRLPYRWLVGADGQNSQVRKWMGFRRQTVRRNRFGFCSHFQIRPWSDAVEVHWSRGCQVFVTPLAGDEVGIAVLSRDPLLRVERALWQFPVLAEKLQGAAATSREVGDTTSLRILPAVTRGRIALVGDASGTVDALTGHGLSLAFQQALALAEAMERGDLSRYASAHKRISAIPVAMSRLVRMMECSDWIRRRTLRLFQNSPGLFSRLLAIHTEALPLGSVRWAEIVGFGWEFLKA